MKRCNPPLAIGLVMVSFGVTAPASEPPGLAKPASGGPACTVTACVPEPATTVTARTYYDCERKEYCLPRCPWPWAGWLRSWCGTAKGCPDCGPPRHRNVLIKRVATEETPGWKCVPRTWAAPTNPVQPGPDLSMPQ